MTWKDCFRRLICQLVGEQASIGTWEDGEIAIVKSKVHVLGKVSSMSSTDPWDTSQNMLSRCTGRIPADEWMLKIVAENDDWGLDTLQSLLAQDKEDEMVISEDVMVAAAGNVMHVSDMVDMLLREYGDRIVVKDRMKIAAAQNRKRGKMVMQRLMKHGGGEVPKQESR